ncbi:MAG: S8 family serine peptidase, partial [Lachnospiraceae bacterium]|nr:S8 family serine peptidase [Lachnospiraceae bacterium]
MKKKNRLRALAFLLVTAILTSLMAPAAAQAEVVEDFTPRRIMIKREETEGAEDYSVSFFASYEPAEEIVITDGLTVMDAGRYDMYSLYYDQSVVAVEDDALLAATGDLTETEDTGSLAALLEQYREDSLMEQGSLDGLLMASGMESLQEQGYLGGGVKVAVFDTEVEETSGISLAGKVSFLDEEQAAVESDAELLHGTVVASILSELVPMAELYSVEVLDETGNGYYSSLIRGIYWAVEQDMDVLVMSLGGGTYSAFLQEALQFASWHDIVVLAAAGNEEGGSILYPAAYPETLSVGAADEAGQPLLSYADGMAADLLAPGKIRMQTGSRTMVFEGSSVSAPVAGAAAVLLRSISPELSREQVMALLLNTSEGIVNAEAAVEHRMSPVYTRLTNRNVSMALLAQQEEALDGVMEAQVFIGACTHLSVSYGPMSGHAYGHQRTATCNSCGATWIDSGVDPNCALCQAVTPTPRPTSTPVPVNTATPTPKPTSTPTPQPTRTPTPRPTSTPTPQPTSTPTPRLTSSPAPQPTQPPTMAPTPTETPWQPTSTPVPTARPTGTPLVTSTPWPTGRPNPTATNTPRPIATYTPVPTIANTPTPAPAVTPTPVIQDDEVRNTAAGGDTESTNTVTNGDPVNMVTGSFYLEITDMYFQGIGLADISITRSYNSVDTRSGLLGPGWRFAYESSLTQKSGGDVSVIYSDGRTLVFEKNGSTYRTPAACQDTLTRNADGTWKLVTEEKLIYTYTSAGKLASITDQNGNTVTFSYSGGNLVKITGADGLELTVTCSGGKLRKITDPFGRTVNYSYDSQGRLIKVSGETCGTMTFTYDSHGITSITDGNGSTYIKNEYDSMGRV